MKPACPPDDQLLALATDEPGSVAIREHVDECTDCRMRVKLLRGEIAELRSLSGPHTGSLPKTVIAGSPGASLASGTAIDRYHVVGDLGSGGQADVYRVIDPELHRDLVLKLSHRQSADGDQFHDALLAEARLLAALDHPGLVRVFNVGLYEGRPYLVLDHVPGRNLEQTFAGKPPSVREAARLIAEVARVVAYAHRHGVVHGDITPRNILIDGQNRPRLIDFGLSKFENAWGESRGPRGGTPEFLPPEIVADAGQPPNSGPAGDVFGLGATLYWLLVGQPPFVASTPLGAIARARRCDIDFDALKRAGVPARVERICRQALAGDPHDRPAADLLADTLERASRRWLTRRVATAIGGAALVTIGLVWGLTELWEREPVEDANVVQSAPAIGIFHRDRIRNLSNELPLRTGDQVSITCDISQGRRAVMLWFNAAGELKSFSPVRDIAGKVDRLIYPAPHRATVLEPPEGTEMIFFCRGDPVDIEGLQSCFPIGNPPPAIPDLNWLELRRDAVETKGPLTGVPDDILQEIEHVEELMKDINRKLLGHFKGVTGIAFPHRRADQTN
jgi:Protein kinase domain